MMFLEFLFFNIDEFYLSSFGSCLGEIGAIDPANVLITSANTSDEIDSSINPNSSNRKSSGSQTSVANTSVANSSLLSSTDLIMNPTLVSDDSGEFSENFSRSLIIELSKVIFGYYYLDF